MKIRIFILCLLIFILSGCTGFLIKVAYNKADWIIKNEIDKLFDITWNQDSILSEGLSIFLSEHRRKELPRLYTFMENVKQNILKEEITVENIYQTTNEFMTLRSYMFDSLISYGFTEFVATLDMEQVNYLEGKMVRFTEPRIRNDGKTYRERTDQENFERTFERRKRNMITAFGEITPVQEKIFRDFPLFNRKTMELYYLEKKRIGEQAINQLRGQVLAQSPAHESVKLLRAILVNPRELYSPSYLSASNEWINSVFHLLVDLHKTLTPEQKKYFVEQIEYYQEVVSDLIKNT